MNQSAKYPLRSVSPQDVAFNDKNPRGEKAEQIQSDKTFEQLKNSVAQFGVLVPIVVHKADPQVTGKNYILVDGERRLRAALSTNQTSIPAHLASSKDTMDEIIQAFHIHMLRKQWKPVAMARAFRQIRDELVKTKSYANEKEILTDLQAQTGCTNKQIEDLRRVIKYPEKVLKEVDADDLKYSHLVQIEASTSASFILWVQPF